MSSLLVLLEQYRRAVLLGYIILGMVWFFLARYFKQKTLNRKHYATQLIDQVFYKTSMILYKNKEKIHNYDQLRPMLYDYKQQTLSDTYPSFIRDFMGVKKDFQYLEQLLTTTLIPTDQRSQMQDACHETVSMYRTYMVMKVLLAIFGVGVGWWMVKTVKL